MNCRGKDRRVEIVNNYDVIPVAHLKLINGRIIHSDAGGDIIDSYFIFSCKHKTSGKVELIHCGIPTAREICELIGKPIPRIFNPLRIEQKNITSDGGKSMQLAWNKTRKQLYNATMLLIIAWDAVPNTPLFEIKEKLETHVAYEPYDSYIKAINTIISKRHTTIRNIINELNETNDIKDYAFDAVVDRLKDLGVPQYFEAVSID